jgi:hypothetical protein
VVHFNVTEHPTAEWAAAQLMQAFPWDTAPRYILRDRDRVYGKTFRTLAADMQITEVLTAARSPWQRLAGVAMSIFSGTPTIPPTHLKCSTAVKYNYI